MLLSINSFPDKPEDDETIILPSTYGWFKEGVLNISVRAWIFELEEDSLLRNGLIGILKATYDDAGKEGKKIFEERIRYFMTDNHWKKDIKVNIMGKNYPLPETELNGHTYSIIRITDYKKNKSAVHSENFSTLPGDKGTKPFSGTFYIIGEKGYSIISDIDDTIKISNVLNKEELIDNTFIRKFVPVKGMSELYRKFEKRGAAFHYLSGSPWQLYPPINTFLNEEKFPGGSIQLKFFRVKDKSFIDFISADQLVYKTDAIRIILQRFPQRKFILIGDSGEKDPEVYSGIAAEYKDKIKFIFIRDVGLIDENSPRRKAVIEKAGKVKLVIFKDPVELERYTFL
jgi:hypothetical protein